MRVRRDPPSSKLIALIRNPIDSARSQYVGNIVHGSEYLAALETSRMEEDRLCEVNGRITNDPNFHSADHVHYSYKARGVYADQINRWHAVFPKDQLLILPSEDLYRRPSEAMSKVSAFLGIESYESHRYRTFNAGPPSSDNARARAFLTDYFRPHNRDLEDLLRTSLPW